MSVSAIFPTQPGLAVSTLDYSLHVPLEGCAAGWGCLGSLPCFLGSLVAPPKFSAVSGSVPCQEVKHTGNIFQYPSTRSADSGAAKKNHPSQSGKGRDSWNPKKQTAHLSCVWSSVWGGFVHNLILEEMCPRNHSFSIKYNKMKVLNTFPSLSLPSLTLLFAWLTPVPGGSLPHHADVSGSLFEYL